MDEWMTVKENKVSPGHEVWKKLLYFCKRDTMWRYSYKNLSILFYVYYILFRCYMTKIGVYNNTEENTEETLRLSNYIRSYCYYMAWSQVLGPQVQCSVTFQLLLSSTGNTWFYDKSFLYHCYAFSDTYEFLDQVSLLNVLPITSLS